MATISLRAIEVAKTISGNTPHTLSFFEAASNSYKKGAVLVFDSSGNLVVAGTNPTIGIVGIAVADSSADTVAGNTKSQLWVANPDTIFIANLSTGIVSKRDLIGTTFGLTKVGNNWHVDTAQSGRVAMIVDLDSRDNVGDTQARVHFIFIGNSTRLAYTS